MDDKLTKLADQLDLLRRNRDLVFNLRLSRIVLMVTSVLYIILLISNMNKHMKWYEKGRRDAYEEIIKRIDNHGRK